MKELKKLYKKPSEITRKLNEEHEATIRAKRAEFINYEIQELYWINLVTCWQCGEIFSHDIWKETIVCPHCKFASEPCDFPDLFY